MNHTGHKESTRPAGIIHVMAVGPVEQTCGLHDALLIEKNLWFSVATDYRELWARSNREFIHVFVLCETLSGLELTELTRFIRQQWPNAKIMVIRDGEGFLEDPLYDERVPTDISEIDLIETIEELLREKHE